MLENLTLRLRQKSDLAQPEITDAVRWLTESDATAETKAQFLTALAEKGETADEIAGFARELLARCVRVDLSAQLRSREVLDVVGTGGDRLSTFNISTAVALLCAAAGVLVAKHGNRASTSPIGSADVMEALDLDFDFEPQDAVKALDLHGFAYFFAPKYHPAFKNIVPARKVCAQQGRSTVFNFLGPLLNPARPSAMLLGVSRPELCEPLARVLQAMGVRRAMVVCGAVPQAGGVRYLDEISPLGPTTIAEFYQEHGLNLTVLDPRQFPMKPMTLADITGGDRETNATIVRNILGGTDRGPKRDAVLLNAAAALFIAGAANNLQQGWDLAERTIDSGAGTEKFATLVKAHQARVAGFA